MAVVMFDREIPPQLARYNLLSAFAEMEAEGFAIVAHVTKGTKSGPGSLR